MKLFLSGAMVTAYLVAGLFFLQFWKASRDRLFLFFAVAFGLLGLHRVALTLVALSDRGALWPYGLRLLAFLLILAAIIDKNRGSPPRNIHC
jgi:hypothetical protein